MDKIDREDIKQGKDKFKTLELVRKIDLINGRLRRTEKDELLQRQLRSLKEELALTMDDKTTSTDSGIVPDAPDLGPLSKVEWTEDVQADNIEALKLEFRQQRLDIAHGGIRARTPSSYNLPISADWRWPHAYQIFKIPPHTTCFVLNGAMKISCQEKSMTVKARFCPLDEFDEVATTLRKQKMVIIQSEFFWPW